MPVFIDGRAELYGEAFDMAYYRALQLKDVNEFLDILRKYDIDAVLLTPGTPRRRNWSIISAAGSVSTPTRHAVLHVRIGAEPVQAPEFRRWSQACRRRLDCGEPRIAAAGRRAPF